MNKIHLNKLIEIGDNDQGYVGTNSLNWGRFVVPDRQALDPNLNKRFNRYDLFEYCKNAENSNLNVLVAILSWGGMNRNYGISLFNNINHLLPIVENLRLNKFNNRSAAFNEIQNLRNQKLLPGLGIGYFTKIICFLSPNLKGYIMDQWASKSVNLLMDEKIIKIQNGVWVNDQNDSVIYERFYIAIDELASILNCDGFEAEKRIFSVGYGKGKRTTSLKNIYKLSKSHLFKYSCLLSWNFLIELSFLFCPFFPLVSSHFL